MELTIDCQKRQPGSKPNALRREGRIPAVLYGHNGAESVELTLEAKVAETLVKKASVNNTLVQLNVKDLPWSGKTLIREVQTHPWKGHLYHLSFFSIGQHDSVDVTLPLHFVGESIGVKTYGGMLDTVITEVKVKCPPDKIPDFIEVDVTDLNVGDSLSIGQLKLPSGVEPQLDSEVLVVSVLGTRATDAEAETTTEA